MVVEKHLKKGSAALYKELPKGFLSLANKLTGIPETSVRDFAIGNRYDDSGFVDVLERISVKSAEFHEFMNNELKKYANENTYNARKKGC